MLNTINICENNKTLKDIPYVQIKTVKNNVHFSFFHQLFSICSNYNLKSLALFVHTAIFIIFQL